MEHIVDTNHLIYYLNGVTAVRELFTRLMSQGIALSVVSYMEVREGLVHPGSDPDSLSEFIEIVANLTVLPFTRAVADVCADIREQLRRQGRRVRQCALDLMVAATAIEHDLTLVTWNVDDYDDIPGLRLYRNTP